jgi:hypothetical protein
MIEARTLKEPLIIDKVVNQNTRPYLSEKKEVLKKNKIGKKVAEELINGGEK